MASSPELRPASPSPSLRGRRLLISAWLARLGADARLGPWCGVARRRRDGRASSSPQLSALSQARRPGTTTTAAARPWSSRPPMVTRVHAGRRAAAAPRAGGGHGAGRAASSSPLPLSSISIHGCRGSSSSSHPPLLPPPWGAPPLASRRAARPGKQCRRARGPAPPLPCELRGQGQAAVGSSRRSPWPCPLLLHPSPMAPWRPRARRRQRD